MKMLLSLLLTAPWLTVACPTDMLVMYRMVLHTEWSEETFPKQYPEWRPPAQWSVVIGRSHNTSGLLWRLGKTASDSVKQFVETGRPELLLLHHKKGVLSEFFAPPVTQGVGATEARFFCDAHHSKVSMMCRITPSPDWFIGVDSFDLCQGGKWVDKVTLDLEPTDGGTDNGYTFTSPKWATDPRSNITPIKSYLPDHPASSFFYPELDNLPRIAYVTFLKTKEFYLTKRIPGGIKEGNLTLEASFSNGTHATVISSPSSEMERHRYSLKQEKMDAKHKKKMMFSPEISAFRSKAEATTKKARSPSKKQYRSKGCRVSEWSEWGECSRPECGFGEQLRKRKVVRFASKNGRPCPPLQEARRCGRPCRPSKHYFTWQ